MDGLMDGLMDAWRVGCMLEYGQRWVQHSVIIKRVIKERERSSKGQIPSMSIVINLRDKMTHLKFKTLTFCFKIPRNWMK